MLIMLAAGLHVTYNATTLRGFCHSVFRAGSHVQKVTDARDEPSEEQNTDDHHTNRNDLLKRIGGGDIACW